MSKFSVAIIGGGIGGVTLALALSKYPDIHFDIYEATGAFEEIGAGVGVFARSIDALTDMGVVDHLEKINTPFPISDSAWNYRKSDISPEGYDFARRSAYTNPKGVGSYRRSDFLSLMVSLLPQRVQKECVHFRKRLTHYEQDANGVTLHFTDGTTANGDILIGADGIKSRTRLTLYHELAALEKDEQAKSQMLKHAIPRWSGMVAYRGLISAEDAEKELGRPHRCAKDRITYCGKQAHIVVYPVAMGKMINISAYMSKPMLKQHKVATQTDRAWPDDVPWVEQVSPDEMLTAYDGFEDEVIALLKCIEMPSRWAIHELDPLPSYAHNRVALLGDAAHAAQPHRGQGANQSIEDAYTLAVILGSLHITKANIPRALKAYERARLSRANDVIRSSSENGRLLQFMKAPEYDDIAALKTYLEGSWHQWLFLGSPREAAEEAVSWMTTGPDK